MGAFDEFSMPLAEAMTTQRAIRRLKSDPVDDALVLKLIELALKGPTAQDEQGCGILSRWQASNSLFSAHGTRLQTTDMKPP